MSEFTCRNGHILKAGQNVCPKCGQGLHRMDGMTNSELKMRERAEEGREYQDIKKLLRRSK